MNDIVKMGKTPVEQYRTVRQASLDLCQSMQIEDFGLQVMPEVSPPKWHLAHTSWFFETFVLKVYVTGYQSFHPLYDVLFNSYYNGIGEQYPRSQRGFLSRPTVKDVKSYRQYVDEAMQDLLCNIEHPEFEEILQRCNLGLNHEQQHQELICTDIKYSFSFNPLYPALISAPENTRCINRPLQFIEFDADDVLTGYAGQGFHFDNEKPAHKYHLQPYKLADRVINNAEYLAFIEDGGYSRAELWLADGWMWKQDNNITQPCYWRQQDNVWYEYTLHGLQPLSAELPLCHINFYEADAYARWSEKRLPTEQEWETACRKLSQKPDNELIKLHPPYVDSDNKNLQMFGSVWQWTQTNYSAYPGYQPDKGAIGEYNGKFMCNQMVLRGSSCVTPPGHARITYRNFFYAKDRWQFSGIRLADSA